MDADKIVVLNDDGTIAGIGTHDELLKTCRVYQEIVYSSFQRRNSMSDEKRPTSDTQPRGMMGQGGRCGMMPGEKPKDFSGTVKRLLAYFKPEMIRLIIVVILTITSVVFTVYAPRILGNATNELFKGS